MSVAGDGPDQLYRLATEGPIDAIYSDYLAEVNIAMRALEIREHPELGYETAFLTHLGWKTAAAEVVSRGIKVVHNGGALNPRGLYEATTKFLAGKGLTGVKIAWVDGDNVTELVQRKDESYQHLDIDDLDSAEIGKDVLSANAYIGMRGILAALNAGAQIVICGRCCDASPPMALAAWWHGWRLTDWDRLAGSLVAGHVTKCGPYSTGGNFCGFKAIPRLWEVGHPIAEIEDDGSCVVTMHEGSNGAVTVDTITAQLVYEIQGPAYLNPDVTAILDGVELEGLGPNRVRLSGVKGILPPPTTKLAICALGGYQAEVSTYAVGLDIEEKAALQRKQILGRLNPDHFSKIAIDTYGSIPEDPLSQKDASVQIRHFIQAPTKDAISEFKEAFLFCAMQGYGGYHLYVDKETLISTQTKTDKRGIYRNMDLRTLAPKPFVTYFPGKIEQSRVNVQAHLGLDDAVIPAPPLGEWRAFTGQLSYDSTDPVDLAEFGDTKRAPLGKVVLARSGDKGGNANVGLWVRRDDEWPWLRLLLTIDKIKHLLGNDYKPEFRVERFELPKLRAVHFVIYGLLEDGVSSSSLIDGFAKSVGEFIRARQADVPTKFLSRPHVGDNLQGGNHDFRRHSFNIGR